MSLRHLGQALDIHGGGRDLIFPHHENEIAQSESFTGVVPFVRYWMHNGLLQLGGEKMSKSLGVLVTVKEVLQRFSPDAVRLFILSSHYRSPLSFSEGGLEAAEKGMERLRQAARGEDKGGRAGSIDAAAFRQGFIETMDDDFNSAQAIAVLFDLTREINRARNEGVDAEQAQRTLLELAGVLGLTLEEKEVSLAARPFVDLLVSIRSELREKKQWQLADKIRSSLQEMGIVLEDTAKGTVWRRRQA
jgi:cysteinyl-tRNA synthetase